MSIFFQSPPTEEGMKELTELVATYPQGFMTWLGPIVPLIHLCHPDIVRSVVTASGIYPQELLVVWLWESESFWSWLPCFCVAPAVISSFLLLYLSAILFFHVLISPLLSFLPSPS